MKEGKEVEKASAERRWGRGVSWGPVALGCAIVQFVSQSSTHSKQLPANIALFSFLSFSVANVVVVQRRY